MRKNSGVQVSSIEAFSFGWPLKWLRLRTSYALLESLVTPDVVSVFSTVSSLNGLSRSESYRLLQEETLRRQILLDPLRCSLPREYLSHFPVMSSNCYEISEPKVERSSGEQTDVHSGPAPLPPRYCATLGQNRAWRASGRGRREHRWQRNRAPRSE